MAEWKMPVGADPLTGVKTTLIKEGGEYLLHHHSDEQAILDANKRVRTLPQKGKSRLAARTPAHFLLQWATEFEMKHGVHPNAVAGKERPAVRRKWRQFKNDKLNSREFAYLRVDDGRKL